MIYNIDNNSNNYENLNYLIAYSFYLKAKERLDIFVIDNIGLILTPRSSDFSKSIKSFFISKTHVFTSSPSEDIYLKEEILGKEEILDLGVLHNVSYDIKDMSNYDSEMNQIITDLQNLTSAVKKENFDIIFYWDIDLIFQMINYYLNIKKQEKIIKFEYRLNQMKVYAEKSYSELIAKTPIIWVENVDVRYWLHTNNVKLFSHKYLFSHYWKESKTTPSFYGVKIESQKLRQNELFEKNFQAESIAAESFIIDLKLKLKDLEEKIFEKFNVHANLSGSIDDFYSTIKDQYKQHEKIITPLLKEMKITYSQFLNKIIDGLSEMLDRIDGDTSPEVEKDFLKNIEELREKLNDIFSAEKIKHSTLQLVKLGLTTLRDLIKKLI